jgi:RimJ/RimL family protein N-acetyltransferase
LNDAVRDIENGSRLVFTIIQKSTSRIAGSMAYGNISSSEKKLEIGWSWLGKQFQGTGVNGWAKYLMLEFAFETLECERIEFKTDVLNIQARRGLQNIGATEEGVLRSFNYMPDNRRRDAIYYSILKNEWPAAKNKILTKHKKHSM